MQINTFQAQWSPERCPTSGSFRVEKQVGEAVVSIRCFVIPLSSNYRFIKTGKLNNFFYRTSSIFMEMSSTVSHSEKLANCTVTYKMSRLETFHTGHVSRGVSLSYCLFYCLNYNLFLQLFNYVQLKANSYHSAFVPKLDSDIIT